MTISYEDALQIVHTSARCSKERAGRVETVPLLHSLGRIAGQDHFSPIATPSHDTSAMDGYAVSSEATTGASTKTPVVFVVRGTIAACDKPIDLPGEAEHGEFPCVEIMTGARFPRSNSGAPFDACVKVEDTVPLGSSICGSELKVCTRIIVTQPVLLHANRRFAGEDMQEGDIIVRKGSKVCPRHIMALASVGITGVVVRQRPRVAVWSTGNELAEGPTNICSDSQILNSNGPYLMAALQELGVDAEYKSILRDDPDSFRAAMGSVEAGELDLMITTGAVSKGKFDFIVPALEELRAHIQFHGVAIRPGHPVLFATIEDDQKSVPLFGLPGNPIATAACFRFLVVPFLEGFLGSTSKSPTRLKLLSSTDGRRSISSTPSHLDCFRHGVVKRDESGERYVYVSENQSPAVISPFMESDCWVHIPRGHPGKARDALVSCYPHVSSCV